MKNFYTGSRFPLTGNDRSIVNVFSSPSFLAWRLASEITDPTVVILPDEESAFSFSDSLEFFLGKPQADNKQHVITIPDTQESVYTDILPDTLTTARKIGTLSHLFFQQEYKFLIGSISSFGKKTISKLQMNKLSVMLAEGLNLPQEELSGICISGGYEHVETVEDEGTYSIRGQVADIFVPMFPYPFRLVYDDEIIESIYWFDPETQKRLRIADVDEEIYIHPVTESVLSEPEGFRERLFHLADSQMIPATKTKFIQERVEEHQDFFGKQALLPIINNQMDSPLNFLENCRIIIIEEDLCRLNYTTRLSSEYKAMEERLKSNELSVPVDWWYQDSEHLFNSIKKYQGFAISSGETSSNTCIEVTDHFQLSLQLKNMRARGESTGEFLKNKLRELEKSGQLIVISVSTEPPESVLVKTLTDHGLKLNFLEENKQIGQYPETSGIYSKRGYIRNGFTSETHHLSLFTESELFGEKITRRKKRKKAINEQFNIQDIKDGDYVVHEFHGIGLYRGLFRMSPGNIEGDYVCIEYESGDKLYLPAHRISTVTPYRGGEKTSVKLDKLGGKTWAKTRSKAAEKIVDLADKLLEVATERNSVTGISMKGDNELLNELEITFPWEETEDQMKAINSVLKDLSESHPMDRLICGDVGFGKTEVAMRAAFAAATSGYQVAVLAPTTLLCEQHYRTFSERFSAFPVTIRKLSRFNSKNERKSVLDESANGKLDILIATHRLLSPDIHFKNLGLLIVDEEQKFGVAQKEKLRFNNTALNVLYLSATPIPRTLNMGLTGLKDISLITTPPRERQPIKTNIGVISGNVITSAVLKELNRGGQVFFVTPRISSTQLTKTIHEWEEYLHELIPEIKTGVIHGKMKPSDIESVMFNFLEGKINTLVSTGIIESGLDISRANTLIVTDAHLFGLSQLYQLRGRVGRGTVKANAWFLVPQNISLTDNARLRLMALQRYSHLGSGFNLASEDLEIRGSGDLLGSKQSGTIAAVGFNTYIQLIEEARQKLSGLKPIPVNDPDLNLDFDFYIDDSYISDPTDRLVVYRTMTSFGNETELADYLEVLQDRYGVMPEEMKNLTVAMRMKIPLRRINAVGINLKGNRLILTLNESANINVTTLLEIINSRPMFSFMGENKILVKLSTDGTENGRFDEIISVLRSFSTCAS
ncbi:MAG: transcription-repair coupling factor [Deltaproteobacteria bacterium]|nr:transcription-repair coupling factor [Deltaproteobacteria bacterium]